MDSNFLIIKGNIIFTPALNLYKTFKNGYIVIKDKTIIGTYESLPLIYKNIKVIDYGNQLIIPGFVDLHLHAPQFFNRGLGLDKELLPWLETYTFPEEAKYSNIQYAKKAYEQMVIELWKHGTTRSVLFGTIHREATELLMNILNKSGLSAFVGKVNMDRNSPDFYQELTDYSLSETRKWLENTIGKYEKVKPIITPRFIPTCTPKLLLELGNLAKEFNIPVQSHLSENKNEIAWVAEIEKTSKNYADAYNNYGLFGDQPTIQAHCIWNTEEELNLIKEKNIMIAHCPHSNLNLSSGIAPIKKYIKKNIQVGLGSDISGGHEISIAKVIVNAIQNSKIRSIYVDRLEQALTFKEAFYLATKGGGNFFGKIGSFEVGYEFDALIIDDTSISSDDSCTLEERLERFIYIGDDRNIIHRYISGQLIPFPSFN